MQGFKDKIIEQINPVMRYKLQAYIARAGLLCNHHLFWFLAIHVFLCVLSFILIVMITLNNWVTGLWLWLVNIFIILLGLLAPSIVLYFIRINTNKKIEQSLTSSLEMIYICSEIGGSIDDIINLFADIMKILNQQQMYNLMRKLTLDLKQLDSREQAWRTLQTKVKTNDFNIIINLLIQTDSYGSDTLSAQRHQLDFARETKSKNLRTSIDQIKIKATLLLTLTTLPLIFIIIFVVGILPMMSDINEFYEVGNIENADKKTDISN